jgi:hypothetical protein
MSISYMSHTFNKMKTTAVCMQLLTRVRCWMLKSQEYVFMTKASCVHNTMTSSTEIAHTYSLSADQSNYQAIQDALQAAQFLFKFVFVISIYLKISLKFIVFNSKLYFFQQ